MAADDVSGASLAVESDCQSPPWKPLAIGAVRRAKAIWRVGSGPRSEVEAQLVGENRILQMVASGCALAETLDALCGYVEEVSEGCRCGVYLIDWRGPTVRAFAAPSLPSSFNAAICQLPIRSETGPCARAACLRKQVIAMDIASDPLWQTSAFGALAKAHGLRSCWTTPIYSLTGQVLGTLAIFQANPGYPNGLQQDLIAKVTQIASIAIERAEAERALRRSEAFLAEAQRLSSTGSFAWRVPTDEITWSEQLYRICGFDENDTVALPRIGMRVHPEDRSLLMEMIGRARSDGEDIECELRLLMPDQSVRYLHMIARGTRDAEGRVEYLGTVQDITQRRLSEEALGRARSELARVARVVSLGALTASIAHQVNQPLTGMIINTNTCSRALTADPPDWEGALESARRARRDGMRAAEVIKRLRALFNQMDPRTESVDLNDAAREVIALSVGELHRNRVIVRAELAEDLPRIAGDRVQLQQVIMNLLLNASEAMCTVEDRPRHLLVRTTRDEQGRVCLSVRDSGVGLAPHVAKSLFEPFCTTKSDGMGIGLFVCRSVIEAHRGHLEVQPNEGHGVTFAFAIPPGPHGRAEGTTICCPDAARVPADADPGRIAWAM